MGLLATLTAPVEHLAHTLPAWQLGLLGFAAFLAVSVLYNVVRQLCFRDKNAPPEVWSWFPVMGNT
jgi:sterol 14alpha-demethylase